MIVVDNVVSKVASNNIWLVQYSIHGQQCGYYKMKCLVSKKWVVYSKLVICETLQCDQHEQSHGIMLDFWASAFHLL